jgi:hypothetical protein
MNCSIYDRKWLVGIALCRLRLNAVPAVASLMRKLGLARTAKLYVAINDSRADKLAMLRVIDTLLQQWLVPDTSSGGCKFVVSACPHVSNYTAARTGKPRHHCADRDAGRLGDLSVLEALHVA